MNEPSDHDGQPSTPDFAVLESFTPIMPSKSSLEASSAAWYERAGLTFLDNYPATLTALAPKTTLIEWPKAETEAFFEERPVDLPIAFQRLSDAIDKACSWNWKFLRLNSRSPKDVVMPGEFVCAGRQALLHIRTSERCLEDLALFRHSPHPAYVALRAPMYIRKGFEFRLLVRDGDVIGVAQYEALDEGSLPEGLHASILDFYRSTIGPALHMRDVVVDVCMVGHREWRFLEINPYGLSDPCAGQSYNHIEAHPGAFHYFSENGGQCTSMPAR